MAEESLRRLLGMDGAEAYKAKMEELDRWAAGIKPAVDLARFPHKCPACGGPAYVGFAKVECAGGCR